MICRRCRTELETGERCEDTEACRRRVHANARKAVASMKQIPLSRERQETLYREAMGR